MTKPTKDDELYREMCRVVGKVVLEMRDLGQEPKYIVIAGVLPAVSDAQGYQVMAKRSPNVSGYGSK